MSTDGTFRRRMPTPATFKRPSWSLLYNTGMIRNTCIEICGKIGLILLKQNDASGPRSPPCATWRSGRDSRHRSGQPRQLKQASHAVLDTLGALVSLALEAPPPPASLVAVLVAGRAGPLWDRDIKQKYLCCVGLILMSHPRLDGSALSGAAFAPVGQLLPAQNQPPWPSLARPALWQDCRY